MADRKKIIISTGAEPDEPLPTPHFDTEATLTARPVVPLGEQETYQTHYGDYAVRAQKPFWKRPAMIALIALVAVGIGVAAGIAIGINRNRNAAETPVVTAPPSDTENAEVGQTVQTVAQPEPQTSDAIPEEEEEEPSIEPAKAEEPKPTARNERRDDDEEVTAPPPVVRDKRREKADDDDDEIAREREDRRADKERRREARREERREERRAERRGRRRDLEEEAVFPRGIERAGRREANRIREIFEGSQP
jgi:hypothetical protein